MRPLPHGLMNHDVPPPPSCSPIDAPGTDPLLTPPPAPGCNSPFSLPQFSSHSGSLSSSLHSPKGRLLWKMQHSVTDGSGAGMGYIAAIPMEEEHHYKLTGQRPTSFRLPARPHAPSPTPCSQIEKQMVGTQNPHPCLR